MTSSRSAGTHKNYYLVETILAAVRSRILLNALLRVAGRSDIASAGDGRAQIELVADRQCIKRSRGSSCRDQGGATWKACMLVRSLAPGAACFAL